MRFLLDTNVLIPFHSKNFLMELGYRGLPVHWSVSIETEFVRVWARLYPDKAGHGPKILTAMHRAVPEWRAPESRKVLQAAALPDPYDRHVLAAAVGVGATVIVTRNLKDFPQDVLAEYGIVARSADDVLCRLFDEDPEAFLEASGAMRRRLKAPPMTAEEWINSLMQGDCVLLAAKLRPYLAHL